MILATLTFKLQFSKIACITLLCHLRHLICKHWIRVQDFLFALGIVGSSHWLCIVQVFVHRVDRSKFWSKSRICASQVQWSKGSRGHASQHLPSNWPHGSPQIHCLSTQGKKLDSHLAFQFRVEPCTMDGQTWRHAIFHCILCVFHSAQCPPNMVVLCLV